MMSDKAEDERSSEQERNTVTSGDHDTHPERQYDRQDSDDAGGITNRPLSDEIGSQESLPERGTSRDESRDPDSRRQEGDYEEDDPTLNTKI